MKIQKFERANLKLMREELDNALNKIASKYGLESAKIGTISYTHDGLEMSTKLSITAKGGTVKQAEEKQVESELFLKMEGLKIGQTFTVHGKTLAIVSYNSRRPKNPISLKDIKTGKQYKSSVDMVKNACQIK